MRRSLTAFLAVLALAIVPARLRAQSAPDPRVEHQVRAAVDSFSHAVARGDSAAAIRWLHPGLVVYESGYADDLAHYRREHLPADIAYLRDVRIRTTSSAVTVAGAMALYTAQTESSGTHNGKAVQGHGTETIVLLRTASGWRIRHIHWSSRR
ncbi:MAG TPA: nuclear transport factor 2 family protein [Longimicrobiaceae bacterium]|nr:nuclear transport factor 2 family protein [Longimicrobiaceae bacterium]